MAEKKYVDFTGLSHYDEKIKDFITSKDSAVLNDAKDYADSLADNYDAAGSATTVQGKLDAEIARAKAAEEANAAAAVAAQTQADKGVSDAATAKAAAEAADAKAVAAQSDVDALETFVGTLPEGETSATVVAYIDKKTAGIATDASLAALTARVDTAEGEIDTLQTEMDAVEAKAAANEAAITKLNGEGDGSVKKKIDDAFNDFATKISDDGVVNTYKELVDYCAAHSAEAAEMAGDISANAIAIAELESFVGELPEGTSAATVIAYVNEKVAAEKSRAEGVESGLNTRVASIEARFGDGEGSVSDMIADAVATETSAREAADNALDGKITTAQNAADAAQADVDALETVVGTKAAQSDLTALTTRVTTAEGEIDDLQAAIAEGGSVTAAIADAKKAGTDAQADVDALETTVSGISTTVAGHTTSLSSQGDRITALEGKVGDGFVAITNAEIDGLFATTA